MSKKSTGPQITELDLSDVDHRVGKLVASPAARIATTPSSSARAAGRTRGSIMASSSAPLPSTSSGSGPDRRRFRRRYISWGTIIGGRYLDRL